MAKSLRRLSLARSMRRWYVHWRAEVLLVSMPKAGRTWLRVLIGRVIQQRVGAPLESIIRTSHLHRLSTGVPRIVATHAGYTSGARPEEIRVDASAYRGKRIIFLVRDPRDVLVSLYFQDRYRRTKRTGLALADLVQSERDGLRTIIAFYNSWGAAAQQVKDVLLVRYEDLKADARSELRRVFDFIGIDWVTDDLLDEAVRFGTLENMRNLERADTFRSEFLRATDSSNPETFKVRRGKVGGYVDYLDPAAVRLMDEIIQAELDPFFSWYLPRSPQ